jgi:hypothetical protein
MLRRFSTGAVNSITNSSVNVPGLLDYTSGFRIASTLAENVSDIAAEAAGANKVYISLQDALPEFFPPLPSSGFLKADDIAALVTKFGNALSIEISTMRKTIAELQSQVADYQKFIAEMTETIQRLTQSGEVTDPDALKKFGTFAQQKTDELLNKASNDGERALASSLQGLVNTYINVDTKILANFQANIPIKGQANICSVGSQK